MARLAPLAALLCTSAFLTTAANAQDIFSPVVTPGGSGTRHDTRAYLGMAWQFGGQSGLGPKIVTGVQSIDVGSDDDVTGVDLNLWFDLKTGLDRIALSGIRGNRSALANLGVGYDFGRGEPIVTAGAQVTGLRGGVDLALRSRQFAPYFEVNSLSRPDAVASGTSLSCATSGYVLATRDQLNPGASFIFDFIEENGFDVDGRACVDSGFLA